MKIPTEHKWSQTNEGDIFGVLHSTKNVTFDDYGKVTLSKKSFSLFNSVVGANFGYLLSALYYNDDYTFVTDDDIYRGNLTSTSFSVISSTPDLALNSDGIVFNSLLHVTTDTQLSTWNASSWTNSRLPVALTTDVPHPMTIFESQATYQLAIGNGNKVQTYDTSYNANTAVLTLPTSQRVQTMRYRNGYLYVGTKNIYGGEAKIYIWNGSGNAAQYEVPIGCEWVFAMTPYKTTVAAITSKGVLGYVSGSDFVKLDALPIYYKPDMRWQGSSGLLTNGKVFNRGIATVGDRIYLNIDGEIAEGFMPEMHSGLWVYDPRVGLYHRSSTSPTRYVKDNTLSVTSSVITTTSAHKLKDGDGVQFTSVSGLTGISVSVVYYAKVLSTTTIKLAKSRAMLMNADYLTINGTAGVSDILMYVPNNDVGETYETATSGAVMPLVSSDSVEPLWASEVLWGGRVDDIDSAAVYTVNLFCPSYNVGVFETQRIYSPNKKQSWNEFNSYLDKFTVDNEQFILKYRGDEKKETKVMTGIWSATNIINSDSATINQDPWEDVKEGDELVIVSDYGRGYSVHVTNVDTTSSTVVVITIDEEIGTIGEAVKAYATNYKKEQTHLPDGDRVSGGVDISSGWVQLKAELRGFEIAVAINDLSNTKDE
jgi:hypothetical protein